VFDYLLEVCETDEADAAAIFYRVLKDDPWAASFRGHLFERHVLNYLDGIGANQDLPIRGLARSDRKTWTYHGPIGRVTFREPAEPAVIKAIERAFQAKMSLRLVPSATSSTAVDSIVYQAGEALTCIQTTISSTHPIKVDNLRNIQGWLDTETPTKILRPTKKKPWRFLFIVPQENEPHFKSQISEGDTDRGEWAGKVNQYVLGWEVGSGPVPPVRVPPGDVPSDACVGRRAR
jgi:hypothetical protein